MSARQRRKQTARILVVVFVISMLMGPGPGLYLANRPVAVLGVPALYLWGLCWYAVELAVVFAAYFLVWVDDAPPADDRISS